MIRLTIAVLLVLSLVLPHALPAQTCRNRG